MVNNNEQTQRQDDTNKTALARGGKRTGAGRKPIGQTRKISLTLPSECWAEIDRRCGRGDYTVSEILRSIVEDYLSGADLLDQD